MKFKNLREKYRSKFPTSLVAAAVKIALDMGGNMTGAYKKIEAMKRGLGDDPAVKDALRLANEETVKEAKAEYNGGFEKGRGPTGLSFSIPHGHPDAENPKTRKVYPERQTPAYKKAYKALLKKKAPKVLGNFPVRESTINEFATSMTYFNKKGAAKAEKLAKALKIYKGTKEVGKAPNFAYTVQVDGEFDQIEKWMRLI